jgi:predicted dinucleotide-binding enzyme
MCASIASPQSTTAGAVAAAEVVLVAVLGPAVTDVLQAAGGLAGRVMINAANPFGRQQVTLRSLADAFRRRAGCAPSTRPR